MSHTPINSPCSKQRKISTRSPKTPVKKVQKSTRDNCCLICGINFKLSGQGSFFNTTTTVGLKENLSVILGESPDFPQSSRRVCKCCKRKVDSVIKRTVILEQDKAFLIDKYRKNNSTNTRQCARETAELSPPRYKRLCKESPFAIHKQAKSRKAINNSVFFHWAPVSKIWTVQNLFLTIILTLITAGISLPPSQILLHSAVLNFLLKSNNRDSKFLQASAMEIVGLESNKGESKLLQTSSKEIFRLQSSNRENRMLQISASIPSIYRINPVRFCLEMTSTSTLPPA